MGRTIAYIIYILTMAFSGFVMGYSGLHFKTWRYWIMVLCLITAYICGYIRGGD